MAHRSPSSATRILSEFCSSILPLGPTSAFIFPTTYLCSASCFDHPLIRVTPRATHTRPAPVTPLHRSQMSSRVRSQTAVLHCPGHSGTDVHSRSHDAHAPRPIPHPCPMCSSPCFLFHCSLRFCPYHAGLLPVTQQRGRFRPLPYPSYMAVRYGSMNYAPTG